MPTAIVHLDDTTTRTFITIGKHSLIADEPESNGGTDMGPTPTEILTSTLGACTAITLRLYARRKGWDLRGVDVEVTMEKFKASEYPAYQGTSEFVNEFRQTLTFHGDLTEEQRARLLEIAGKCPVHKILTQPNFMFETMAQLEVNQS